MLLECELICPKGNVSSHCNDLSGSFGGLISQKFSDAGTIVSGCLSLSQNDLKLLTPVSCEHVQNESAFE